MNQCSQCGVCCKLFMINLTEEEYKSKKYKTIFEIFGFEKDFEEAERNGSNILAMHDDESCIYLQEGKCSIHDKRPSACRKFFCDSKDKQFESMIKKIENYKKTHHER